MEELILIDGNSLLFKAYYATASMGNLMVNKDGIPTNAVFGFANMLQKILERESAYIVVAFDLSLIHISEPTRRVVISYAVFCLKKIFFNDTATTEIYTRLFVGSVRCV